MYSPSYISEKKSVWATVKPYLNVFDGPLLLIVCLILTASTITMISAAVDYPSRMEDHLRNIALSLLIIWVAALVPPQTLMRLAVPAYLVGTALLVGVALFGLVKLGARRWINVGVVIQPSEIMKIAMPMMLAWWFQKREGVIHWQEFLVAGLLLAVPAFLIIRQPDLGTGTLVTAAGFYVIFLAGLQWRVLFGLLIAFLSFLPVAWHMLHDYQRHRVLTLIDPTSDPLGKGFHIIQSMIAIGSGGMSGKGWMKGTQGHLQFIPERTTDFIFAVYSEEFGLIGNIALMILYLLLIGRGLLIAANAPTLFSRLLAGALSLMFFTYAFVNMGMVIGILPVVGVPLPFMSYGGTAFVTLGLAIGILMSIHRHRKLIQS